MKRTGKITAFVLILVIIVLSISAPIIIFHHKISAMTDRIETRKVDIIPVQTTHLSILEKLDTVKNAVTVTEAYDNYGAEIVEKIVSVEAEKLFSIVSDYYITDYSFSYISDSVNVIKVINATIDNGIDLFRLIIDCDTSCILGFEISQNMVDAAQDNAQSDFIENENNEDRVFDTDLEIMLVDYYNNYGCKMWYLDGSESGIHAYNEYGTEYFFEVVDKKFNM